MPRADEATPASAPSQGGEGAFLDRVRVTSQLVAGLLHEFNTPLGALRASLGTTRTVLARALDALEDDPAQARQLLRRLDEVLALAQRATERLVDSIGTLASFARVDRAGVDEVELEQLVETALRLTGLESTRALRLEREVRAPRPVRCRVREVQHVLVHLLRNAAEALRGQPDPCLGLTVTQHGDEVRIEVRDNGPGLDPALLPTLFEPALTTKGQTVGLGLSLPTCRFLAQEHGGSVEGENRPEGGARFTFWFRALPPR
jgi:C4-dicarboxylate-specific signal transduction histidine kinase